MSDVSLWDQYSAISAQADDALARDDMTAFNELYDKEREITAQIDAETEAIRNRNKSDTTEHATAVYKSAKDQVEATRKRLAQIEEAVASAAKPREKDLYEDAETAGRRLAEEADVTELAMQRGFVQQELEILESRLPWIDTSDEVLLEKSQDLEADIEEKREQLEGLQGAGKDARRRRAETQLAAMEAELAVVQPEMWLRGEQARYQNGLRQIAEVETKKARQAKLKELEAKQVTLKKELDDGDYGAGPVLDQVKKELDDARNKLESPPSEAEIAEHSQAQAANSTTSPGWWKLG